MDVPGAQTLRIEANGFAFRVYYKPSVGDEGLVICQHGIGSSALTFARFLAELHALNPSLGLFAYDVRHHGYTEPLDGVQPEGKITDLDLDTLQRDFEAVAGQALPCDAAKPVHILLLGHSMGGTLMAKYANSTGKPSAFDVRGLVVVDAVEGYARKSLSQMHSLLSMWPPSFESMDDAISWHLRHGNLLRSRDSARISVPPLFKRDPGSGRLTWKLDLGRTDGCWDSWFEGLDEMFIKAPCARLLILAGMGRLDTALTRAQMQGKFQLLPVNESGHYIQEDAPQKVAFAVADFWLRNGKPINIIPKFGQLRSD